LPLPRLQLRLLLQLQLLQPEDVVTTGGMEVTICFPGERDKINFHGARQDLIVPVVE